MLYLLRFPGLCLAALAAFGPIAFGGAKPLLGALLDHSGDPWGLAGVCLAAWLMAAAGLTSMSVIVLHARERMGDDTLPLESRAFALTRFLSGLISAGLLMIYLWRSSSMPWAWKAAAVGGGLALAGGLTVLATILQLRWASPRRGEPPPYLVFPFQCFPEWELTRWLESQYRRENAPSALLVRLQPLLLHLRTRAPGIVEVHDGFARIYPGHLFAAVLTAFTMAVYFLYGVPDWRGSGPASAPALVYLILALMICCWALSGLSFLGDRWRMPVVLLILACFAMTGLLPSRDHFYRTREARVAVPTPSEIFRLKERPVLVAAAGGGIHAAVWTARVLQGLEQECARLDPPCDFRRSVALISGISGGSAGAMHYAALPGEPVEATRRAAESSLDDIGWGLVNPDLRRVIPFVPFDPVMDRGWALERSWEARLGLEEVFLADWGRRAASGDFPALLFSGTIVERGTPIVFSTTAIPRDKEAAELSNFHELYDGGRDVRVSTAARLSAGFPYVAPAARSDAATRARDFHIVDGGYHDNYGLLSLMRWLDDAAANTPSGKPVLIIKIRGFWQPRYARDLPEAESHGWLFQSYAPAAAFLQVREAQQFQRVEMELRLLTAAIRQRVSGLVVADFEFPRNSPDGCGQPPLSWKLTQLQKDCIEEAWTGSRSVRHALRQVTTFLR
jgi:hypothetical protein